MGFSLFVIFYVFKNTTLPFGYTKYSHSYRGDIIVQDSRGLRWRIRQRKE